MRFGVFSFNTDYGMRADVLARELEARGFDSLWVGEHTHIPASRVTPYPGGGELPRPYYHMVDPFVSLMAAAGATEKLLLATGICLVIERDPITLAKEVASLDFLSGGRFLFGIGGGWNAEEMENHGTPFDRRWKVLRENVEAMKAIWAEEQASYAGEFVSFEKIISFPKPVQAPHPPVVYGGTTRQGLKRIARYCDGWLPFDVMGGKLGVLAGELRTELEAVGRDPDSVEISVFCFGVPDEAKVEEFRALGAKRIVLVAPRDADGVRRFLDERTTLVEKLGA